MLFGAFLYESSSKNCKFVHEIIFIEYGRVMDGKEHKSQLQLYDGRKVRTVWDEDAQEWFFSVVDVVAVLTGMFRIIQKVDGPGRSFLCLYNSFKP